jgi:UDP-2-acetamido-2,6-beta-L-arabino-hexul-4-ose reductase
MSKIKVGITGQSGFIGAHLARHLRLDSGKFELVPFRKEFFESTGDLDEFVKECDVIVHLAAVNRHEDPEELYTINVSLTQKLIDSLIRTSSRTQLVFSSSTQETADNPYGKAKSECVRLLEDWASAANARVTSLTIPNVFGPFSKPEYNTFIATFCHKLIIGEQLQVNANAPVKLIYVGELTEAIITCIDSPPGEEASITKVTVKPTMHSTVGQILEILQGFKKNYYDQGMIPDLESAFHIQLFNTFRSFIDYQSYFPKVYQKHSDPRGSFVELIKLESGGQVSFSTTKSGVTRGNHFHTRKVERFSVISGHARIELRKVDEDQVISFDIREPAFVDMPIWYTHNITNIGENELLTVFWINEKFDKDDPDTFYLNVRTNDQ